MQGLDSRRADRPGLLWPLNDRIAAAVLLTICLITPPVLALSTAVAGRWFAIAGLLLAMRWLLGQLGRRLGADATKWLALVWPVTYLLGMVLIGGGFGLTPVPSAEWGGLMLTLLQASFAILLCFPLGVMLALGRRSSYPLLRWG